MFWQIKARALWSETLHSLRSRCGPVTATSQEDPGQVTSQGRACWLVVRTSRALQCLEQEQLFLLAVLLFHLTSVLKGLGPEGWVLSPCSPCSCVLQRPLPRRDCFCGARGRRPRIRTSTCRTSTSGECPATASQPISFPRCLPPTPAPDGDLSSHLPHGSGLLRWEVTQCRQRSPSAADHSVQGSLAGNSAQRIMCSRRRALAFKVLATCQGLV